MSIQENISKIKSRYPNANPLELALEVWEGEALDGDTDYFKEQVGLGERELYEVVHYAYNAIIK